MAVFLRDVFPREVWERIWSFDPTGHQLLAECHREMRQHISVMTRFAHLEHPNRIVRNETKKSLQGLCDFLGLKLPKHVTKSRLVVLLYGYFKSLVINPLEGDEAELPFVLDPL